MNDSDKIYGLGYKAGYGDGYSDGYKSSMTIRDLQEKEKSGNLGETRNAALGEVRVDVKELLQMIAEIPCTCDKIYTDRKLRAPDCPRCNWVEDDIVKKVNEHFA